MFCFMSFSALSATAITETPITETPLSTYGAMNLAFILGLSLPIVFITLLYKTKATFLLPYFILQTLCLFSLQYFVAFYHQENLPIVLSFSSLYVVFLYFNFSWANAELPKRIGLFINAITLLSVFTLVAILGLYPNDKLHLVWVGASLTFTLLYVVKGLSVSGKISLLLLSLLWHCLAALYFTVSVFLWLTEVINSQQFLLHSVGSYVLFLLVSYITLFNTNKEMKKIADDKTLATPSQIFENVPDTATNLPSQQRAQQQINHVIKDSANHELAIIVFKPINFQQVNKILGHQNSDILLLQLAYSLQTSLACNDKLINFDNKRDTSIKIARLKGLHFLVAMEFQHKSSDNEFHVKHLCNELTLAVPEALSFKSFSLNFELAFGISFLSDSPNSLSEVIAHAEDALLSSENKASSVTFFNKQHMIYNDDNLLQMERLKQDIIDDKLHWAVQPSAQLNNRQLKGFELFVQWHTAEEIPIDSFVFTAEHSGEIYLLTKEMINRAFKLVLHLQRLSRYEIVSIKLLSEHLLEPDLVGFIEKQIDFYHVSAKYFMIELPEQVVLSATDKAKKIIDELTSLGIKIGISDFTGSYESLRYIRKMAVDQIKINCGTLSHDGDVAENEIISALIQITKEMQLTLIGSEIDNVNLQEKFIEIGGEIAQGNVISESFASDKLDAWITRWNNFQKIA